jgi:hypothetical protein
MAQAKSSKRATTATARWGDPRRDRTRDPTRPGDPKMRNISTCQVDNPHEGRAGGSVKAE